MVFSDPLIMYRLTVTCSGLGRAHHAEFPMAVGEIVSDRHDFSHVTALPSCTR